MTCYASDQCFIQQRYPCVMVSCVANGNVFGGWATLPGTIRWELQADVDEAQKLLTCDTNGKQVKVGSDIVEWSLEVESALCYQNWLYLYLLAGTGGDPTDTACLAFFATWLPEGDIGTIDFEGPIESMNTVYGGIAGYGNVTPGGFGVDGNSPTDAMVTTWTIGLLDVFFPANSLETLCPTGVGTYGGPQTEFPASPVDAQTYVVPDPVGGDTTYTFSSGTGQWTPDTTAYNNVENVDGSTTNVTWNQTAQAWDAVTSPPSVTGGFGSATAPIKP